ncbi:MAG: TonB-dependent receptor, partial [Candidatus Rokuibacteriota bacterium]
GYRDVEQVLHDLPGFDISRGNGDLYSTLYQRGYRSNATDRTLVLVDGIEQNDLHSNIAYVSRQYPLSNIDRIEVVYGPASTMYGPNAFSGVINIITKEPDAMIGDEGNHAARIQGGAGAFNTLFTDATYAGRSADGTVSWSATGRVFRSAEPDLSFDQAWRYGFPAGFDRVPYRAWMLLEGKTLDRFLCARLTADAGPGQVLEHPERCAAPAPAAADLARATAAGLTEVRDFNDDGFLDIVLTDRGVERAKALDTGLFEGQLRGRAFSFSDPSREWFGSGKLKFSDFTVGMQAWRSMQGTAPWYRDYARGEGGTWVPRQTAIFATYVRPLSSQFELNVLMRYKNDQIDDESAIPLMATYANGYLSVLDLVNDTAPVFTTFKADQVSTQFRTEVTALYQRSNRWNAIVGADIRDGSSQGAFFLEADRPLFSFEANARPEELKATDVGLFAQGSYQWRRWLKGVLGLRYDGNEVRENERVLVRTPGSSTPTLVNVRDFGKFWSPRAALVATLGRANGSLPAVPGQLIVK